MSAFNWTGRGPWTTIGRAKSIGQAVSALARSTADLQKINNQLEKLTGMQTENMQDEIAQGIAPMVKNILAQIYGGTGIQIKSGELYAACVSDVRVLGTPRGFFIYMAPGKDKHVYARAGAFRYGCVSGSRLSQYQRTKTKAIMAAQYKYRQVHGQPLKVEWSAGAKYQPPKEGFYQFSAAHMDAVETAVIEQVRQALKRRGVEVA